MRQFFEKRDPWGHSLALWVVVGMALLLPLAAAGMKDIHLENNIADWLEPENLQSRKFHWLETQFPHDDVVLASWDDSQLADPRLQKFAESLQGRPDAEGKLRGGLPQVEKVRTPIQLMEQMEKYEVEPGESLERISGVLIGPGKLRLSLSSVGKKRRKAAERLISEWAESKLGLKVTIYPPFEDQLLSELENAGDDAVLAEMQAIQHDLRIGWAGIKMGSEKAEAFQAGVLDLRFEDNADGKPSEPIVDDCFFYPGAPAAIAIYINDAGMADRGGTLEVIREKAASVGIPRESFRMAGGMVAASALNQAVIKTAWNRDYPIWMLHHRSVILLSGLVGMLLTFYLLRSFRLGAMVLVVSYYTPLLTVWLVTLTGGSMNMVLVVMPSLLLVLTISGSIHVGNYWKHAAAHDMATAVVKAAEMARRPCMLAGLTTAVGLLSLATSHLAPVRDFGLYAAAGMLISLVMVLYGLPSLLELLPARRPPKEEVRHDHWIALAEWIADRSTLVTGIFLVACIASTAGLMHFNTETKVIKYFEESTRVRQDYNFLENNLSGIVPVQVVVRFRNEESGGINFARRAELVRQVQERVRQMPDVSGTLSLADFLPMEELPAEDASALDLAQFNAASLATERKVKEETRAHSYLVVADDETEFSKPGDELWRITAQVAILTDLDYGQLTDDLDNVCAEVLRIEPSAGHVVTGMVPLFLETQREVLSSLIHSFGLAFVLIGCVLMAVLKHPLAGIFAMLPNVLPIGMVFGTISWFRIPVDIGTMITASVALGIAVDGTVHLLTWFSQGLREGMSRKEALGLALGHCGPAMLQTSVVTSLGLIVLFPAELLLISRFGWLMAALIAMALVADIVLLPALLTGRLGGLIERQVLKAQQNEKEASAFTGDSTDVSSAPDPHLRPKATSSVRRLD